MFVFKFRSPYGPSRKTAGELTLHSQESKDGHDHDIFLLVDALLRNNGVGVHNLINTYVCMHACTGFEEPVTTHTSS